VGYTQLAQVDTEAYGQADFKYDLDNDLINQADAGVRFARHDRHETVGEAYGCYNASCGPTLAGVSNGQFPSNFGSGAGFSTPFTLSVNQSALQSLVQQMIYASGSTAGPARQYWPSFFSIAEDTYAGYVMARIGGNNWSGNIGVRAVNTDDKIRTFDSNPLSPSVPPITGSLFGTYYINQHTQNYTDVLPSMSLKYDVNRDLVARVSASETIARPDYYALAGGASLNDAVLSGSQGNPDLKPTRSANFDASLEWYYAPESLLSFGMFDMQMQSTFDEGTIQETLLNLSKTQNPLTNPAGLANPIYSVYTVTAPVNNSGYSQGFELQWQQPVRYGFGFQTNYTYSDSAQNNPTAGIGGRTLLGSAKHTVNMTVYYQIDNFNAHVAYTEHSSIYEGIDRATKYYLDTGGSMDASVNYSITKNFALGLDVLNMLDQKEVYNAGGSPLLPRATYDFGRTFFFSLNAKY
jgi:iron complex outermembrane receptor protein